MSTIEDVGSKLPLPRPPLTGSDDGQRPLPWLTLPNELKMRVMRHFVPSSVSFADYESPPGGPIRRPDNEPWASRQTLAAACLASRQLETICSPLLYEAVALKNHRELSWILRSLVRNPRLRARVRRLAWVYLVCGDEVNQRIFETGPDLEGLVVEVLSSWPSTSNDRRLAEIFQLSTADPSITSLRKALGVVLSMLPRIEALIFTHGGFPLDFLGLNHSTGHHPVTRLLDPALLSLATLEEIIVDLSNTPWTLWFLILNCPSLRRVGLKGRVSFDATLPRVLGNNDPNSTAMQFHRPPELHLLPRAVGDNVQEICLYRSHRVQWDVLPKIFPNLERLVTVFERDAWREEFWSIYPPLVPSEKLPEELGQVIALYKSSLRSLTVTGSLSVNDWRTGKDYRNSGSPGFLSLTAPIIPLLSPGLPQVPLIELTADCVWLFGRVDPSVAYQISSLLPSSLVSLHLIDYWAVSIREEGIKLDDEQLSYYPVFPSDLTPLDFLDNVFAILHDSCAAQHTRLKHITLSSPMFDEDKDERWPTLATPPVDRADVQAWQARVGDTFARIGVIFSFTTMRQLETSIKCSWARM